jgi:hypothetical protein
MVVSGIDVFLFVSSLVFWLDGAVFEEGLY